ncbi:MAG TPA: P-loop NTPase fold protein, partial [Longimicrobium sp.]
GAAVLGAPAVGFVLYALLERLGSDGWARVAGLAAGATGMLATGTAWVRKQLAVVRRWRMEVENAKRRVDSTLVQEYDRLREAESRRGELQLAAEAARQGLEEARHRLAKAEARLRSASLAEELTRFVGERFGSGEYRSQLSTLARVREDFERLSELIEEENWRLTPPLQGEDISRRGLRKFETLEEEAGDRGARVNRIVLYIDDLDRCPPAKVVEVLQAVHLLLAFPLFVVVVGVDARWVVRSVETRYRELLRAGQGAEERVTEGDDLLARVGTATAHDYLEKIFQIPFWLRSMTDRACQSMVRGLLASSVPLEPDDTGTPLVPQAPRDRALNLSLHKSARDPGLTAEDGDPGAPRSTVNRGPNLTAAPGAQAGAKETRLGGGREPLETEPSGDGGHRSNLNPGALQIQRVEVDAIEELAPLLGRSPRALKRFVNVYRLVKASLTPYEREVFLGSDMLPDYRAVLFLLAVDTGAPSAAAAVFSGIRDLSAPLFFKIPEEMRLAQPGVLSNGQSGAPHTLTDLVRRLDADPKLRTDADWARVRHWLVIGNDTYRLPNDLGRLGRWVPRVSRYSFHTGRMERPHRPALDPTTAST